MYAENWHLLTITISIACLKLHIVVDCSCLELVSLFQFLIIGILIYTGKRNLSSDVVCVTDPLHAQCALLCDLSVSHRMKQTDPSQSSGSITPFLLPSEGKECNPCEAPHTLDLILLYLN